MNTLRLPDFTLPPAFARLGAALPQLPPALLLVQALELGLRRQLPQELLDALRGKRLCLRVSDAGLNLRFTLGEDGFETLYDGKTAADLTISARARDFLALALRAEDPDALFFSRRLLMEGDTELGLLIKNTLDAIDLPVARAFSGAQRALAQGLQAVRRVDRSGS